MHGLPRLYYQIAVMNDGLFLVLPSIIVEIRAICNMKK